MVKTIRNKVYDTENSTLVKKVCVGEYGDPAGYETCMFQTADGFYFLYSNGGVESPYTEEKLVAVSKVKAAEWLQNN